MSVHRTASEGYGQAAELYARARPSFPDEAVDWLLAELAADSLVEIGAGTGKFTALLVARGIHVVAVEPVPAMRERLAALGVETVPARAEDLPFADGSVDGAIASQSLHWCDVPVALRELDRVLAPGAAVGLVWNFRDLDVAWQRELDDLLAELRGDAPHSRDGRWEAAVEASAFAVTAARSWQWALETDTQGVVDRVRSVSYVAALDEAARSAVDGRVRAILERHTPAAFPYVTEAYVLRRAAIPSEA